MIKLAISGAHGRMGQAIIKLANQSGDTFQIAALLEHEDHPKVNQMIEGIAVSSNIDTIKGSDVLIEFTLPEGTVNNLKSAVKHNVKMVIGTTGLSQEQIKEIHNASTKIPIIFASNMSIGVNILFKLIEITASRIGANDIQILETHHIHKKDKPSGTAKTMAEYAEKFSLTKVSKIDSLRKGEVIGDHEVTFESHEDILKIYHHAKDRSMFAKGALAAARFLMNESKGLFTMQDVLGLNTIK